MSPNIRVDQEVYDVLKKYAEPFVDTPNAVLRRLLKLDAATTSAPPQVEDAEDTTQSEGPRRFGSHRRKNLHRKQTRSARRSSSKGRASRPPRVASGVLLPENEYVVPILASLAQRGGTAPAREIIDAVGQTLKDKLTAVDRERNASGQVRWENRTQFVRLKLVEKGLLIKGTDRGVWSLTEAGRAYLNGSKS